MPSFFLNFITEFRTSIGQKPVLRIREAAFPGLRGRKKRPGPTVPPSTSPGPLIGNHKFRASAPNRVEFVSSFLKKIGGDREPEQGPVWSQMLQKLEWANPVKSSEHIRSGSFKRSLFNWRNAVPSKRNMEVASLLSDMIFPLRS